MWPWDWENANHWCTYPGRGGFNDLRQIGLLEGPWFTDCEDDDKEDLEDVMEALVEELGSYRPNGKKTK